MDNAEFNYQKYVRRLKIGKIEEAIQECKETLKLNPFHLNSI